MAPSDAPRLSNTDFLARLTTLFTTTHSANSGSIFLTQKPLYPTSIEEASSEPSESSPAPQVLIRATDGKSPAPKKSKAGGVGKKASGKGNSAAKVKFSTVVDAADLESFFAQYADVCKSGMQGLRKRDRKKGKRKGGKGGATAAGGK